MAICMVRAPPELFGPIVVLKARWGLTAAPDVRS
jgi:hypothetical protein